MFKFTEKKNKLLDKVTEEQWDDFVEWYCMIFDCTCEDEFEYEEIKQEFRNKSITGEFYDSKTNREVSCLSFEEDEDSYNSDISMYYSTHFYRMKIY